MKIDLFWTLYVDRSCIQHKTFISKIKYYAQIDTICFLPNYCSVKKTVDNIRDFREVDRV
jgi:hypothetical protein